MIYRDLYCSKCGNKELDVIFDSINDSINQKCSKCQSKMSNLCACGSFELKYDNKKDMCGWSADNYDTSQYYRDSKD